MPNYWIVVGSEENLRIARSRGFDMFGFKSSRRREASQMRPGDKLIFYLTGIMKFGGVATVTSEQFEDHTRVFKSEKPARPGKPSEDYPFRVRVQPDTILEREQYLDVKEIAPRLEYPKKWPPEHWRLAFQGNLHRIPESDYRLIVREMEQAPAAKG
ncbi:MAG: EVE domain-containing protein [Dehalococcoidia bacterium]